MNDFLKFIRERAVAGLAIGFILGGAVSALVASFINDIANPFIGLVLGSVNGLKTASFTLLGATISWGNFIVALINFLILALVVYGLFKLLRLDQKKS